MERVREPDTWGAAKTPTTAAAASFSSPTRAWTRSAQLAGTSTPSSANTAAHSGQRGQLASASARTHRAGSDEVHGVCNRRVVARLEAPEPRPTFDTGRSLNRGAEAPRR